MIRGIFLLGAIVVFAAELAAQPIRIPGLVDAAKLQKLTGHVNPQARPDWDRGVVDPAMRLNWVRLIIQPSAAQQADLDQFLRDGQNPRSPLFHKWLTPEQFADRFGASRSDIAKITAWMQSQGFDVIRVGRGRRFIAFNATAQQIQNALKTEIHRYQVEDDLHFANSSEPSVPQAIAPLVMGFQGLNEFGPQAQYRSRMKPNLTLNDGSHALSPGDLAVIYDINPIYDAGLTGSGLSLAVIGQSQIDVSDVRQFNANFGVPHNLPRPILVPGADNPGFVMGDEGESDLDVEEAGAIAPDAQILFVYSSDVVTSVTYAIDQALAPVISYSYAACELRATHVDAAQYQSLAQQANAEGITWIVSSGDAGPTMCDQTWPTTHGLSVSIEAAVPEITGVGGTEFPNDTQFWSGTNSSDGTTALSYIPEAVWDEHSGLNAPAISEGGGGYSVFFQRPAWQTGAGTTGGMRGVPDVSLTAAVYEDPYYVIESGEVHKIGGTSASAPVFAGIILLLNQFFEPNHGLGNINPNLYYLAQAVPSVFHDVTTGGNLIPCSVGTPDCGQLGNYGFVAGPGWDAATGWGSIDATAMFNNWSSAAGPPKIGAVVNGASLTNTGISPGQIFTIFGSALGPANGETLLLDDAGNVGTLLTGISVGVGGNYAPLLYVGPGQINAVAPYELVNSLGRKVSVQVFDGVSQKSNEFSVQVVPTAPAIFSLGNHQGAILNQNGSVNGAHNPAAAGTYIQIYGTGEGQTSPPGVDGQIADEAAAFIPRPTAKVSVTIGGVNANVAYAGTAPQSFAGFFQVNAQIPPGTKPGNQPVVLIVGGVKSPPLNVAVK
ncbi:MAG TPA: protease pro-enzyme activation domain-containing protein [Bryobacteraceae bacterium]|nr:protease pro-enzyme activation domain-containing protein [Bryobacteraceae bacterium]